MKMNKTASDCLITNLNTSFYLNLNSIKIMIDDINVNFVSFIISKFGFLTIYIQNLTMEMPIFPKSFDVYLFMMNLGNIFILNSTFQ